MNIFIICASGPFLNKSDCEPISGSGLPGTAVNSTRRAVPDCEYIYVGELRWWDANIDVLPNSASRWTYNYRAHKRYGLNLFDTDIHSSTSVDNQLTDLPIIMDFGNSPAFIQL